MNERNKKIITILSIFTIIFTLVGGTLAYWTWTSDTANQTGVAFTIEKDFSCSADGGQNINSTNIQLQPTSDCTNSNYALQRTIKVTPDIKRDNLTISLDMWLTVNSLGEHLSNSNFLRYAITTNSSSCTDGVISKGNFKGMTVGDKINLLSGKEYVGKNLPQDTYYLYIWLDAKEINNNTQNQSFDFSLGGECTDANTLSHEIMSLSNVSGSNVYKESYYKEGNVITTTHNQRITNVISADDSVWKSIDMQRNYDYYDEEGNNGEYPEKPDFNVILTPLAVPQGASGVWNLKLDSAYHDGDDGYWWVSVTDATMTLTVKNGGYYLVDMVSDDYISFYLKVNNKSVNFLDQTCKNNDDLTEENFIGGNCMVDLGYLNSNDKIVIYMGNVEDEASGTLKFYNYYYEEKNEYTTEDEISLNTWRYEGEIVDNNYINFNNERWRILGVEEGSTIGLEKGKYYTKIIRNEYLQKVVQDDVASLIKLYDAYYNKTLDEYWEEYDYSENGLTEEAREYVVRANWGEGYIDDVTTPLNTYIIEKIKSNVSAYVGAMTPGDYGLSALQSECGNVDLKNFSSCKSWLFKEDEALLSGYMSDYEDMSGDLRLRLNSSGNVELAVMEYASNNRPVVYLNHNVVITGGSGKIDDKYEIALGK